MASRRRSQPDKSREALNAESPPKGVSRASFCASRAWTIELASIDFGAPDMSKGFGFVEVRGENPKRTRITESIDEADERLHAIALTLHRAEGDTRPLPPQVFVNGTPCSACQSLADEHSVQLVTFDHDESLVHDVELMYGFKVEEDLAAPATRGRDDSKERTVQDGRENLPGVSLSERLAQVVLGPDLASDYLEHESAARGLAARAKARVTEVTSDIEAFQNSLNRLCDSFGRVLSSPDESRSFAKSLNARLRTLGFRLRDPETGTPGVLNVVDPRGAPPGGYFVIRSTTGKNGRTYDSVPPLVLSKLKA